MSLRQAEGVKAKVEALVAAMLSGQGVDDETSRWLSQRNASTVAKLAAMGLCKPRESMTLGGLVDAWMERRSGNLAPGTVVRLGQGSRSLLAYFGAESSLSSINEGKVEDYRESLLSEGLAEATVRKRCSDARVWFRYAVRHGYTPSNPFEAVPTSAIATSYLAYISEADARKVMAELADPAVRLIFTLARWGGLRTVSEPKAMTWDCIDWERSRIIVKSPKTQRHAGHEQRTIPMFPELAGPLQDAFDRAEAGEAHVLPTLQTISSAALRKPMLSAIKRAGVKPWPRLWHNLRSSRQTDLEQRFPSHVVCSWLGNSTTIARRHYLQVLDGDFDKATSHVATSEAAQTQARVQNRAQQAHARPGIGRQGMEGVNEKTPVFAGSCGSMPRVADIPSDPDGI